jgi:alpha,alpha-trehalose phosphorylase
VIPQPAFAVEPWCLRETELQRDLLAQSESVFALSNGHIGLRGNLDEGEPHGLPGTYLNAVYELRPLPYAEAGYGYPESGQTVINVTNGKLIRLLVDDEPFDIRYGTLRSHERLLDFRAGTLRRVAEWVSPAGRAVRVTSERLVSLSQRAIVGICYDVEVLDGPTAIVVQSELVANEQVPQLSGDPRVATVLDAPLQAVDQHCKGTTVSLVHTTRRSGLRVGAAMDHIIEGPPDTALSVDCEPDSGRVTATTVLRQGERLRLIKLVAYGWSAERSILAVRDQVDAALTAARHAGWQGLLDTQRADLDAFWARADVELDGDVALQQAVRFGLFHTLQAGLRGEGRAIPAKGLTGPGYDGHAFWDTETFVLPVLTYTAPEAAVAALRWRHRTLAIAEERARQLGLAGAAFPWRTIAGEECSSYWPAGTAAFHVNADIAAAVLRYCAVTGDDEFHKHEGFDLLVQTARLWRSLGHFDIHGHFRIDGVTGPDEYSAMADNNLYTNLMAQRNLRAAADAAEMHTGRANEKDVSTDEMASWRDAADAMVVPYSASLGVHEQAEGFTQHEVFDFSSTDESAYPLLLHVPYFQLYRKQVVKQADLVLAMHLCGDAFSDEEKLRNFDYYEPLTVRDSSLSAATQAVMAAEVGHLDLAYDYAAEAAFMDLEDREHNTRDGLHIAAIAGTWTALVAGFGGLRDRDGEVLFRPRLPDGLVSLTFRLTRKGSRLTVTITHAEASYRVAEGDEPIELGHYGERLTVSSEPVRRPIPMVRAVPAPSQPPGRRPVERHQQLARR